MPCARPWLSASVASAQVADIVIGVPNWPSVAATASILKVVLEENFGLEVELRNGTNPVIFEARIRLLCDIPLLDPPIWEGEVRARCS